jgi:hypothetical protein
MKRLVFSVLLVVGSAVGAGALTVASGSIAAHAASGVNVYVGYADTARASATNFPTPWSGDTGVTFEGCTSSCTFDAGAVRVVNTTAVTETIDFVKVHIDTCTFNIWGGSHSLPAGGQLIFTQTIASGPSGGCATDGSFDSSDVGPSGENFSSCTPDGIEPTVEVSVNSTDTTYTDTAQVINTGGIDLANCPPGTNESTQWQLIGGSACAGSSTLTLAPPSQVDIKGTNATVTATFANDCSPPQGLQGATVNFTVISGPNNGKTSTGTSPTDANGQASFTYSSSLTGTDTVEATITNLAGTITSNDVTILWITTTGSSGHFGDAANLSATFTDTNGNGIGGAWVSFALSMTPGKCITKTIGSGLAQCQLTPKSAAGPDTLTITFLGNLTQPPISTQTTFTVTHEDTALTTGKTLKVTTAGKPVSIWAQLTDPVSPGETGSGGGPISGQTVTISLGSGANKLSCSGTTGSNGVATCSVTPGASLLGTQPVTASYAGNAFYQASSA